MSVLFFVFLLWNSPLPGSLDQIKTETDALRRARMAIDYAAAAEKIAETAYTNGDLELTATELSQVEMSLEIARESFVASRKTPETKPGPYKYAEVSSHALLVRMADFEHKMKVDERDGIAKVRARAEEIHDAWFDGLMESH